MNVSLKDFENHELLAKFTALLPDADIFINSDK